MSGNFDLQGRGAESTPGMAVAFLGPLRVKESVFTGSSAVESTVKNIFRWLVVLLWR
jgi:hypothetical protein